jgi:O-antigen ligase
MLNFFNSIIVFSFIFSFFNDNFLVTYLGNSILKLLFILFFFSNALNIYKNFFKSLNNLKYFYLFFIVSFVFILIQFLLGITNELTDIFLKYLGIFTIVIFFYRYEKIKMFYFTWFSILISIIICFFNSPINEWTFRKTGGTGDPNEFATHVLIFLSISLYLYSINKYKTFLFISIFSGIYGLLFAASMSSLLVLSIVITFLSFKLLKIKRLLVFIPIILIFFSFNFTKFETINNVLNRSSNLGTADARLNSWKSGFNMVKENTILGVGVNNYEDNTLKYSNLYLKSDAISPHNVYIKLIAESGLIVFISFIIFLFSLILTNFKLVTKTNNIYLLTSLLSVLLMGLSIGITYDNYFWFAITIYLNILNSIKKENNENYSYNT